ncbi:MAG: hypothetical protein PVS3B1_31800 [Ktedonobacteraceae bacterium]
MWLVITLSETIFDLSQDEIPIAQQLHSLAQLRTAVQASP